MVLVKTKRPLSLPRRRLLEMMQRVNFGRIEGLTIHKGEPEFVPPPRCVRVIKLGCENDARPELGDPDFALKSEVLDLFRFFDRMGEGTVDRLEVKYGLPFRMNVEDLGGP
jgi:hypothetical protein